METDAAITHKLTMMLEELQAARYYIVAPAVVLYYDWLLTLSAEVDRFWRPRLTGPTVLFLLNRYVPIFGFIPTMLAYFSGAFSPEVCAKHIVPLLIATNLISQCVIGIVLLLRTYALYNRSHSVLLFMSLSWVAATAVGSWGGSSLVPLVLPSNVPGCLLHVSKPSKYRTAGAYMASLIYEILIYILTIWKTFTLRRAKYWPTSLGDTLLGLVIRDGSVYFLVLLGAHLLTIVMICVATSDLRTINLTFTHLIPVTIISRLLLNLRKDIRKGDARSTSRMIDESGMTLSAELSDSSGFLSVVLGNIGERFGEQEAAADTRIQRGSQSGYESEVHLRGELGVITSESIEMTEVRKEGGRREALEDIRGVDHVSKTSEWTMWQGSEL